MIVFFNDVDDLFKPLNSRILLTLKFTKSGNFMPVAFLDLPNDSVLMRDGVVRLDRFATAPYVSIPANERWSLPLLYLVWAMAIAILYVACRWFAGLKARRTEVWLKFL